jgi:hypothetical protein
VSLVTLFAQAKRVTRSPEGSGSFASRHEKETARSKWIPALAGMTSREEGKEGGEQED